MSKARTFILVSIAFILGVAIAWQGAASHYNHIIVQQNNDIIQASNNSEIGMMLLEVETLERLRSGNTTGAVERLEFNLDWTLIGLTRFLEKKPEKLIDEVAVKEIQKAKDYRTRFPRTTGTQVDSNVADVFDLLAAQPKY